MSDKSSSATDKKSNVENTSKSEVNNETTKSRMQSEQQKVAESRSLEQQQPTNEATNDQQQQSNVEEKKSVERVDSSQKDSVDDVEESNDDKDDVSKEKSTDNADEKKSMASAGGGSPTKRSKTKRRKGEKLSKQNVRIGFIGAGKMTEMIVKGLLEFANVNAKQIYVSSKSGKTHDHYKQLGCSVTKRNYDIFGKQDCDVIFLAVHGYVIRQCYQQGGIRPMALTTNFIPNQKHAIYILSLIGGVSLNDIRRTLLNPDHPDKYQIEMHRLMLNHSVGYGQGYGALDVDLDSKFCSQIIRELLTPLARFDYVPENQMDIACALAGCGSAFCYYFLTAMSDGAFKKGLTKAKATKIAADALRSAAISFLMSGKNASDLRDTFASPSGPAIYGIHVLDKDDFPSGISTAVEATYKRIKELTEIPLSA